LISASIKVVALRMNLYQEVVLSFKKVGDPCSSIYDDPAGQLPRIYGCESIFMYLCRTVSARPTKFYG